MHEQGQRHHRARGLEKRELMANEVEWKCRYVLSSTAALSSYVKLTFYLAMFSCHYFSSNNGAVCVSRFHIAFPYPGKGSCHSNCSRQSHIQSGAVDGIVFALRERLRGIRRTLGQMDEEVADGSPFR